MQGQAPGPVLPYQYKFGGRVGRGTKASGALVEKELRKLGANLKLARTRRAVSLRDMADRMRVSVDTVVRMESGDPKVGIGIVATALSELGLDGGLKKLADPGEDLEGAVIERSQLPRRVRKAWSDRR
ncbi:MAG: helix-turn-helix domain-containing protein [Deltaproteobacteria bacterium]|nr:helix-turn-helix domain-containing protein [Deltaproteobacteria bacterium]